MSSRQVNEYAKGKRREFDLELAPEGPDFNSWSGKPCSIFRSAPPPLWRGGEDDGHPGAARAVGAANGANPIALIVPCHRVIGTDGSLTGYGGGCRLSASCWNMKPGWRACALICFPNP